MRNLLTTILLLAATSASAGTVVDGNRVLVLFNPDDGNGVTCCCPPGHEQITRPAPLLAGDPLPPAQSYCVFTNLVEYSAWIKAALAAKKQ